MAQVTWAHISLAKAGNTARGQRGKNTYIIIPQAGTANETTNDGVGCSMRQSATDYQRRYRKYFQPFNFPKLVITIKLWPNLLKGNNSLSHRNSSPDQEHTGCRTKQKQSPQKFEEANFSFCGYTSNNFFPPSIIPFHMKEKELEKLQCGRLHFTLQLVNSSWDPRDTWLCPVEGDRLGRGGHASLLNFSSAAIQWNYNTGKTYLSNSKRAS